MLCYRSPIFKAKHTALANKWDFLMSHYPAVESCSTFEILNKWTAHCSLQQELNMCMLWFWDNCSNSCLALQGKKYRACKPQLGVCHRPPLHLQRASIWISIGSALKTLQTACLEETILCLTAMVADTILLSSAVTFIFEIKILILRQSLHNSRNFSYTRSKQYIIHLNQ